MGGKRMIGIGMDYSPMSKSAVRWVIDNLVVEGDQIILIHVLSSKSVTPQKELWGDKGSPLIPLDEFREMNLSKQYGITADPEVLQILDAASKVKKFLDSVPPPPHPSPPSPFEEQPSVNLHMSNLA